MKGWAVHSAARDEQAVSPWRDSRRTSSSPRSWCGASPRTRRWASTSIRSQAVSNPPVAKESPVDPRDNGWLASSLELLGGVRVSEAPMDTLPGELIDEFYRLKR